MGSRSVTAEETRSRIVEAALGSLHEEGILGASARAIARRGNFNQALIFYHFGGVNELLLAAVDELSARRCERYERRLEAVSSLHELVIVASELHAEDLRDGHITVLSQMLAAAATNAELRGPMRERFEPWIEIVERTISRTIAGTPYAELVPVRDMALAITGEFIGLELLTNLSEDDEERGARVFRSFELLAAMLEVMISGAAPARGVDVSPAPGG